MSLSLPVIEELPGDRAKATVARCECGDVSALLLIRLEVSMHPIMQIALPEDAARKLVEDLAAGLEHPTSIGHEADKGLVVEIPVEWRS